MPRDGAPDRRRLRGLRLRHARHRRSPGRADCGPPRRACVMPTTSSRPIHGPVMPSPSPSASGVRVHADRVTCYYTTDGSEPAGDRGRAENGSAIAMERTAVAWDTLTWAYTERWSGTIPPQPTGTLVRYRIEAWAEDADAGTTWATEPAGFVAGDRPAGLAESDGIALVARRPRAVARAPPRQLRLPRRRRAGPGLAPRRRHLPGLHRPVRDDRWRAIRRTRDARRLLRWDAARGDRASRSHRRRWARPASGSRRSSRARPITATTRPTFGPSSRASGPRTISATS